MYQLVNGGVVQIYDGKFIKCDVNNKEYKTFLHWLCEGNVPFQSDLTQESTYTPEGLSNAPIKQ